MRRGAPSGAPLQPDLLGWKPPTAEEQAKFDAFDAANPRVWQLFVRFTQERIRLGFRHYSADAILHRVRWDTDTVADDGSGFKINNNWTSFYARKWAAAYPQQADFFRRRRAKADGAQHAA